MQSHLLKSQSKEKVTKLERPTVIKTADTAELGRLISAGAADNVLKDPSGFTAS